METKRIVSIGDLHCGHKRGLTPPEWQGASPTKGDAAIQKQYYDFYTSTADAIVASNGGYIDGLIVNGDAIDGPGKKSGSREQITTDRIEQNAMVLECIRIWNPKWIIMTLGTKYHVGEEENWEELLAKDLRRELDVPVSISAQETLIVNGLVFDIKHKVGRSAIPHGRHTAAARAALWNKYWAERKQRPKADIIIRSHVHYYAITGDATFTAFILPALQGLGTEYGARECEGVVDFGVLWFDVGDCTKEKENWIFQKRIFNWANMAAKPVVI